MMGPKVTVRKDGGGFVDWGNGWSDPFDSMGADARNMFPIPWNEQKAEYPITEPETLERLGINGSRLDYN